MPLKGDLKKQVPQERYTGDFWVRSMDTNHIELVFILYGLALPKNVTEVPKFYYHQYIFMIDFEEIKV
jgi:hypothetical protein